MPTQTITAVSLFTRYANPIADEAGLDLADYARTASGLASFLRDAARDLDVFPTGQIGAWLDAAAGDLATVAYLSDRDPGAQALLGRVDTALYNATSDLG